MFAWNMRHDSGQAASPPRASVSRLCDPFRLEAFGNRSGRAQMAPGLSLGCCVPNTGVCALLW